ncbi:MAG: hypothetical protein BGO49_24340 [Planctomycetales bacterium 71-10]|nr:MAG: hypothetical protein BGO49_24340 [Planctomycetales bacterium 71-10]
MEGRLSRILARLRDAFRREETAVDPSSAMIGLPPSQRPRWSDPAEHARDFSERYAEPINIEVESRMMELGVDPAKIGWREVGEDHKAFHPGIADAGNVSPDGRIVVGAGLFNPDRIAEVYGEKAGRLFEGSRIEDRLDSIVAHEYEEHRHGMSHVEALDRTPSTALPISDRARAIAAAMRDGWKR